MRVTPTISNLIKHTSTTCFDNILEFGVHKFSMSNHCMVFCKQKVNAELDGGSKLAITRNMKYIEKHAFLGDISSIKWDKVGNKLIA